MKIGDKLELFLIDGEDLISCSGCDLNGLGVCKFNKKCGNGIFKLLPKQNRITFKNVSSNILHNDKGEPAMINIYMPIQTKEDLALADRIYKKDGVITVEIYLDKEDGYV